MKCGNEPIARAMFMINCNCSASNTSGTIQLNKFLDELIGALE